MWVKYKNWKIEDLNITITINSKCNLSCSYCPLINQDKEISFETLDDIIKFFYENEFDISKKVKNIVFIFFGWEPTLTTEKIKYFLDKMYNYWIHTRYVVYTNWILLTDFFIKFFIFYKDYDKRIIFYISFDWDIKSMKENRLNNNNQFNNIIKWISLLKSYNINFSISKVLYEKKSQEIYKNLFFLHNLWVEKLDFLPVSFYFKKWYSKDHIKEIIKWLDLFIEYLKREWYSSLNIMEYLWLPDDIQWFKEMYKSDYGLFIDLNWDIITINDWLSIFWIKNTFLEKEGEKINIWNIKEYNNILDIIKNYKNFEKKYFNIWKKWLEREFNNEVKTFWIISTYLLKKLFLEKFKPQDEYIFYTYKRITLLEKYYYSDEIYPHEKTWYFLNKDKIYENWKNFLIKKDSKQKIWLVINIPFCETKCMYCTHEIILWNSQKYNEYLDNLEKEAIYYYKLFKNIQIDSLYIWWWTPTVLSKEQLERLYSILFKYYNLEKLSSNMIEFSPNTYTEEKVKIISKYKVNRVTFGIQDIDSEIMRLNNRIQKKDFIDKLLISLKNNKINYVNVDIMAWLKWQTFINFKNTLDYCLTNKNIDDICLNIYKQTNKVWYINNWDNFLNKEYILERNKMINYWRKEYSHKEENIVKLENNLYNFDNPNLSTLSLWYWVNWHIFWKLYYKYNTLKDYYNFCNKWWLVIWFEIILEDEVSKYIILNLKENWICLEEMEKIFWNIIYWEYVKKWIDKFNSKGLLSNFEKEGKIYYRFNKDSQKEYEIYSKYFYRDEFIKKMQKLRIDMNIEDFLNIYFIN